MMITLYSIPTVFCKVNREERSLERPPRVAQELLSTILEFGLTANPKLVFRTQAIGIATIALRQGSLRKMLKGTYKSNWATTVCEVKRPGNCRIPSLTKNPQKGIISY